MAYFTHTPTATFVRMDHFVPFRFVIPGEVIERQDLGLPGPGNTSHPRPDEWVRVTGRWVE